MNVLNTLKLAVLMGCMAGLAPAHAARLALVVGNDSYSFVSKLQNARNDAKLMAQTLREAKFDVTYAENVNRVSLWRAIEAMGKRITKGDDVVFFFAGHGVQIGSNPILLPIDIKAESDKQVERDGVALYDVQDALKDAKVSLLIIDACRDNPFPKQQGGRSVGGSARGLTPPDAAQGQAIIMSAGRNQKALDTTPGASAKNGLFTSEFVKTIKTRGLEVRTALVQVRDRVDESAKQANHEQRPGVIDDLKGSFYFFEPLAGNGQVGSLVPVNQNNAPAPRDPNKVDSPEEIDQHAWEDVQKTDTIEAYEIYLEEYPEGRFASRARIKLSALKLASPEFAAKLAAQKAAAEKAAAEKAAADKIIAEKLAAEKAAAEKAERLAAEKAAALKAAAEKAEADRIAAEIAFAAKVEAERLEAIKVAKQKVVDAYKAARRLPPNTSLRDYLNTIAELSFSQSEEVDRWTKLVSNWSWPNAVAFSIRSDVFVASNQYGGFGGVLAIAKDTAIKRCELRQIGPCEVFIENGKFMRSTFERFIDTHFDNEPPDPELLVSNIVRTMRGYK